MYVHMNEIGFIILRHVNNETTNKYWIHCYTCIRKFYPENRIIIIDDSSNPDFLTEENLYKTHIINSEYPARAEVLPYYYYLHNKFFDTAVIIHDSVFINQYIDMNVENYKILWSFQHTWDNVEEETKILDVFNDSELNQFYGNKQLWNGCFGGMSIITHDYLSNINNKYDISKLLDCIKNRENRYCFERIIGCLLETNGTNETLLGDIHKYCSWGITFDKKDNYEHLPVIKVWTCR